MTPPKGAFDQPDTVMALRLRVVSEHRRSLGERSTVVFGVTGGSIGRSADNDWVLPDNHRYISSRHARIVFQRGAWALEDLSTNGVYVNDRDEPVGRGNPYALKDGDLVRLGEYEILVTVDAATDFPPDPSAIVALDILGGKHSEFVSTDRDIGASLNMQTLLSDSSASDSFRAVNAFGQAVAAPFNGGRTTFVEDPAVAAARRLARLAHAVRKQEAAAQPATPAAPVTDLPSGLVAFCRGAGIDVTQLPAEAQNRMLQLAGQLLRESLLGLKDLDRFQQQERDRYRIYTPAPSGETYSLERGGIDDLLTALLANHDSRRNDPVQWLRDRFQAAKRHEQSDAAAMRSAFLEFIERLKPSELEARFERALTRGKPGAPTPAQYWDLYADFYRSLTEMPADQLPHLFVEAFARAFSDAMTRDKASS